MIEALIIVAEVVVFFVGIIALVAGIGKVAQKISGRE